MMKVAFSKLNSGLLTFQRDCPKMMTADSTPLWPMSSDVLAHGRKALFRMSNQQTDQPLFKPADQSDHILTDKGADHIDHLIFLSISFTPSVLPPPPNPAPPPPPTHTHTTSPISPFLVPVWWCGCLYLDHVFLCVYLICVCSVCECVCVCVCMCMCMRVCMHACMCVYVRKRERMCIA